MTEGPDSSQEDLHRKTGKSSIFASILRSKRGRQTAASRRTTMRSIKVRQTAALSVMRSTKMLGGMNQSTKAAKKTICPDQDI